MFGGTSADRLSRKHSMEMPTACDRACPRHKLNLRTQIVGVGEELLQADQTLGPG
jgi:hypothetical protein